MVESCFVDVVCMCVCTYTCVFVFLCVYTLKRKCVLFFYVCVRTHASVCVYVCVRARVRFLESHVGSDI